MSIAVLSSRSSSSLRTEVVDAQVADAQGARTLRGQYAPAGDRNSRTVSKWPALGQQRADGFIRVLSHDAERRPINASDRRRHPTTRYKRVVRELEPRCAPCHHKRHAAQRSPK